MESLIRFCFYILILINIFLSDTIFAGNLTITGAGATFPYPVYTCWAQLF